MLEIFEFEILEGSKFIVIASDGVWEFLSNKQVCDIVNPYYSTKNAQGACDKLVEESVKLWMKEDSIIDDITCVIIFLN